MKFKTKTMKSKRFPLLAEAILERDYKLIACFTSEYDFIYVFSHIDKDIGVKDESTVSCFNKKYWRIIAEPSEYPKEMYVSYSSEETALIGKTKATIVYKSHDGYITDEGQLWDYAVDIPEISEREKKINEIFDQINELYKSIEKL